MSLDKNKIDYSLYLVTDREVMKGNNLFTAVEEAISGGVSLLQLREKYASTREFYNTAVKMKQLASKYNIPLIINDRLDIMLAVDADGIHIGQNDLPLNIVRAVAGNDKILGCTVSSIEEAIQAETEGADYLGAGPVYHTGTKKYDTKPIGVEVLAKIKKSTNIPVVAIAGINETNAGEIKKAGVDGIAVVSAILGKKDKASASRELREIFRK
jgi:thiamine-phosphate pyrophosphorylase